MLEYPKVFFLVSLSPAPAENSAQAKVAFIFNLTAHNRLNIALNPLNIAITFHIPLSKTAFILKTEMSWQSQISIFQETWKVYVWCAALLQPNMRKLEQKDPPWQILKKIIG